MKKLKEIQKKYKKYNKTYPKLKRKKNDSIVFDSGINSQYEIQIVNKKISIKDLKEDKLNNIIFLLPYLRIKKHIKYLNLEIDKNKIEINNKKFKISNQKNVNLYKKKIVKKNINEGNNNNSPNKIINKTIISKKINKNLESNNKNMTNLNDIITNNRLKTFVKNNKTIKKEELQEKKIEGDGNCLYRSISYFLLATEDYYNEIKKEIINWIEQNKQKFIDFFGDDDSNNITKEEQAEDELNYIKTKNSWGGFHTLEIANIIFNLSTVVYVDNGDENYKKVFSY